MEAVANALGPWYTILGFVATVVGLIVYFRKWLKSIQGEQEQTRQLAQEAANSAGNAATAATEAGDHAQKASASAGSANDSSTQVEQAVILLATELGHVKHQLVDALEERQRETDAKEHLKERTDDLFGALALAEARRKAETAGRLPETDDAALNTGETTITGRHRLHTSMIPTTGTTPTQDDDFL